MADKIILLLASNSPRRRQLLALGNWMFNVSVSDVDESQLAGEAPKEYVLRLAQAKALAVAEKADPENIIIGSDTAVIDGNDILGKPDHKEDAERMLKQLRGRTHQVFTGVAIHRVSDGKMLTELCITDVPMRPYSDDEIKAYVQTGDPMDKAGAYAIQHPDFQPVESMRGCYASVMGLPMCHVIRALQKMDVHPAADVPMACQKLLNYQCSVSNAILRGENPSPSPEGRGDSLPLLGEGPGMRVSIERKRMKVLHWINIILILAFLSACSAGGTGGNPITNLFATSTPLPTAHIGVTPAPDAQAAVTEFLQALQTDDYETMYAMLAKSSRDAITLEDFSKRWNNTLNEMSAASIEFVINSSQISPFNAEVGYGITYKTVLAGDIQRNIVMRLTNEDGAWKVIWDDSLIMPELAGGNSVAMEYSVPARGDIYDREGLPIVSQADAFAFGIQTDQIDLDTRNTLVTDLGRLCGLDPEYIRDQIDASGPGNYLQMCEGTRDEAQRLLSVSPGGLVYTAYNSRYYFETGLAPQAVGYTQLISPEQVNTYRRLGYDGSEKVGQSGIEKWAEEYLAGQHGGILRVVSPAGQIISTLGQTNRQPADSVYLTIDENMQYYAQQAIDYFRGAIVVMEVDTGRIIAMASAPDFDPNYFEANNPNAGGANLLTDGALLNRATQGQYPLGSVFKVITMSAALESGLWTKDKTYDCQYDFTRLPDRVRHDWTWQHCQDAIAAGEACDSSTTRPSGLLTLQEGLMRSCNPYFWEIGWDLFTNWNRGNDISNMARSFGLGSKTGIDQVEEEAGQIIDPVADVDAVNLAIGQGEMQVTPLQVARFMAAIANGGTLYRPQLIERIQPIEGDPKLVFRPEATGTLPLRKENLDILREALLMVTQNPRGTASFNLRGLQFDVAGKTGTAESGSGESHAWFAGYTLNEADTGLPDIAIAVIVENIGEGSEYAVPIFRAMVETYYYGSPQRIFYDFGPIGEPPYTPTPPGGVFP